jgi:lipopolysaccharide transport system ATP-binding protein
MQEPKIEIRQLSKIFHHQISDSVQQKDNFNATLKADDKIVLQDINLSIQSGETIGIIGRNGAGKSTLLSIIVGIASQTCGEVTINGKVTAVMTLGIGLREDMTGRENIYLDGEIQGKSKIDMDALIDKIIDFAELDEFIDKPVKTYSTGMKSRLAFSMLVEIEPEILIIDEALSAGDVFFAAKASKKIQEICQKGKIVILVSHAMATIESMCTRCLWIEKGKIILDDKPQIVTQAYLKKIKEEDDLTDTKNKLIPVLNILENARCKIIDVVLKQEGRDYSQNAFYTQDSFVIEILITRLQCNARLFVAIERIDSLVIHHQEYDLSQIEDQEQNLLFQLSLDSLVLNKGYYQVTLNLVEDGIVTNYYTRLFEVRNNQMHSGGVPLLHYPVEIKLVNEETIKCSDSIELIAG